jgi:hypothetical protein
VAGSFALWTLRRTNSSSGWKEKYLGIQVRLRPQRRQDLRPQARKLHRFCHWVLQTTTQIYNGKISNLLPLGVGVGLEAPFLLAQIVLEISLLRKRNIRTLGLRDDIHTVGHYQKAEKSTDNGEG